MHFQNSLCKNVITLKELCYQPAQEQIIGEKASSRYSLKSPDCSDVMLYTKDLIAFKPFVDANSEVDSEKLVARNPSNSFTEPDFKRAKIGPVNAGQSVVKSALDSIESPKESLIIDQSRQYHQIQVTRNVGENVARSDSLGSENLSIVSGKSRNEIHYDVDVISRYSGYFADLHGVQTVESGAFGDFVQNTWSPLTLPERVATSKLRTRDELPRCSVCLCDEANRLFIGCGHVCTCESCVLMVSSCPMCRARITGVLPVELPARSSPLN